MKDRPVPFPKTGNSATRPIVSFIVPFHGVQSFLAECLESILMQDFTDFEILCIDDASPDQSRLIADFYATRDRRISIITHEQNLGLGPARNTGVAAARGDYLFFLDSDDRLSWPGSLRMALHEALESESEVVACMARAFNANGKLLDWDSMFQRDYPGRVRQDLSGHQAYHALIRSPGAYYMPLRSWGILIDHAFYRKLDLEHPAGPHEDIGHNALMCSAAVNVRYCQSIMVDYRQRAQSISRSKWSLDRMQSYLSVWHHFRDNHARFGLEEDLGNAALHVIRNALWMLDRNNVVQSERSQVLDMIGSIRGNVDQAPNPQMVAQVSIIMANVLPRLGVAPAETAIRCAALNKEHAAYSAQDILQTAKTANAH